MEKPRFPYTISLIGAFIIFYGINGYVDAISHTAYILRRKETVISPEYVGQRDAGELAIIIGALIICFCIYRFIKKNLQYREYLADPEKWLRNQKEEQEWIRYQAEQEEKKAHDARMQELRKEQEIIQKEKELAELSQSGSPWDRYFTYPCKYCGHYKVRPASWDDKRMSVAFWGAASSKIGTRYKCENCGKMWS